MRNRKIPKISANSSSKRDPNSVFKDYSEMIICHQLNSHYKKSPPLAKRANSTRGDIRNSSCTGRSKDGRARWLRE